MSKKFSVPAAAKTPLILYGRHAVTAALANPERKIAKLLCTAENAPEAKKNLCGARPARSRGQHRRPSGN